MIQKIYLKAMMILVVALLVAGCQKQKDQVSEDSVKVEDTNQDTSDQDNPDTVLPETSGSGLFDLIQQIYAIKDSGLSLGDIPVDLTNLDTVKYFTGLSDITNVKEIAVSEAMISSQAYSLVLVQVNDAKNVEAVANEMLSGIDQRKWICVEADDLQVVAHDDVVMLFMVSSELKDTVTSQEMVDAFKEVRGGELSVELSK